MDRIAFVVLMAILAASCAGTSRNVPTPWQQAVVALDTLAFPVDSIISEQVATFQIIAPEYLAKLIASCPTRDGFLKAVEGYKKAMPGNRTDGLTRGELENWIAYSRAVCETPVNPIDGKRDFRWDVFLRYGIPTGSWILPGEWAISTASEQFKLVGCVTYYIYSWPAGAVMLRSDTLGGYPVRVANQLRSVPKRALPIYPVSRAVSLFDDRGGGNSSLVIWVRADELNTATFEKDSLVFSAKVRDSANRPVALPNSAVVVALPAYQRIAAVAWNLRGFHVMACINLPLPVGEYTADIFVSGSSSNYGHHSLKFEIPHPPSVGVSEPVFLLGNPPKGDLATGAITSPNKEQLFIQPNLTFRRGSTVTARVSIRVPESGTYRVACNLIPFSDKRNAESKSTLLAATENSTSGTSGESTTNIHIENQVDVEFKVNFNVPTGFYFFKVEVTDPARTQWIGKPSWVKVEVRESVL